MRFIYILVFFLITSPILLSFAKGKNKETTAHLNKKPLVLQWEVSHSRNTDQISLIFRQDTVELVTNTSISEDSEKARIGYFSIPMDPQLKILKEEIQLYYIRLKRTVSISSLVESTQLQVPVNPHTPVLRINDQEISSDHVYFTYLENTLHNQTNGKNWHCIECATYILLYKKDSEVKIQRIIKKEGKTFSLEELNCLLKKQESWECVDPEFGILVLSKTENNSDTQ